MRVLQLGYIIILVSPITSLRNKNASLKCYRCGGATDFPSCEHFNGSEIFITSCPYHHKSCLKGWVNRNGGGGDKSENGGKDAQTFVHRDELWLEYQMEGIPLEFSQAINSKSSYTTKTD